MLIRLWTQISKPRVEEGFHNLHELYPFNLIGHHIPNTKIFILKGEFSFYFETQCHTMLSFPFLNCVGSLLPPPVFLLFFFFCLLGSLPSFSFFQFFQFSSVAQLCPTLCDPMDCSMPGLPVHHQLLEFTQTHVHRVGDASQPSHPLSSSPSPPAFNLSQHQGLFK